MENKKWYEAINIRKSVRTYSNEKINNNEIIKLEKLIKSINKESNLNIQLIKDCSKLFDGFKASYGLLKGVNTCIALVGNKNISQYKNKIGYYGEMIVLEATSMGLGTCWIGGTYDIKKSKEFINIEENEEIVCVISIGHANSSEGLIQKMVTKMNKKRKTIDEIVVQKDADLPSWVISGIDAVTKAPSAMNKQPFRYKFLNNEIIAFNNIKNHGFEEIDLGISMLHFAIGAEIENKTNQWEYIESENVYKY